MKNLVAAMIGTMLCLGVSATNAAQHQTSWAVTNHDTPPYPKLTVAQRKTIAEALAHTIPCARKYLRYAFPINGREIPFVVFRFDGKGGQVFIWGSHNNYYDVGANQIFAAPAEPDANWNSAVNFGCQ